MSNQKIKDMNFDLTKIYKDDASPEQIHEVSEIIANFIVRHSNEKELMELYRKLYGITSGGHFDRQYAEEAISKMWYEDEDGNKKCAPFFTEEEVKEVFDLNKDDISDYTIHDLAVTMNMLRSDNNRFLERYAKNDSEVNEMVACMSIDYLQDPDAPHPTQKIWKYING